jgi:DNA-binding NtrC family response regulator
MALDLSSLRAQLPGLANRPHFPSDLSVLLLDPDFKARQEVEAQLKENNYAVTPCSCSFEAAAHLQDADKHFDLLLADVRCMQQQSAEHKAVVQAAKSIPLVLMSESGAPNEVMLGIKLGAVDFLEKPLSPLKLKNIWQHLGEQRRGSQGPRI